MKPEKQLKDYSYKELVEYYTELAILEIYGNQRPPYTTIMQTLYNFDTAINEWRKTGQFCVNQVKRRVRNDT